ncbi:GTP cyclohydrolase I FolE [uncultured Bartonella sp.]|uniref:GTP cyclohydrolase I FolE n=1 Tax=uncultured Bartonella sp. TaxID=104108 RepID=UPI0025D87C9D|nr:GTP cyclohydrolase I FolE [uncultured Bartonella sp.]
MQSVVNNATASAKQKTNERPSREEAEAAVRTLLRWAGENPDREGLVDTPKRVVKAYEEMFSGYSLSPEQILGTVFDEVSGYNEPVLVRDIPFYSHCEHHMVPIIGKAHIAYLPDGRVVGLSKIPRVVDVFAKRLQTQESITAQIADALQKFLKPRGVAVLIEAEHMCMAMRGVKKQGSTTITATYRGFYKDNVEAQASFLKMVRGF